MTETISSSIKRSFAQCVASASAPEDSEQYQANHARNDIIKKVVLSFMIGIPITAGALTGYFIVEDPDNTGSIAHETIFLE